MATVTRSGSALADELLQRLGETIGGKANVSTLFGEPVEREGVTVIPVAKARFGFGGGAGGGAHGATKGPAAVAAAGRS